MFNSFFNWLDRRRDLKVERQLKLILAERESLNMPLVKALEALTKHTELMQSWLGGFQKLTTEVPYSSVVRDEDEIREELERAAGGNVDGIRPIAQMESQMWELMKDLNG